MSGSPAAETRRERVLRLRAERLARRLESTAARQDGFEVALVSVGAERFGVPVSGLREILPMPAVTHMPGTPPWMLGITQVRGELAAVVDLARWLGVDRGAREPGYLLLLEGHGEGPLGLTADSVLGFRRVHREELERPSEDSAQSAGWPVAGLTRDLVAVLDLPRLLQRPELVIR